MRRQGARRGSALLALAGGLALVWALAAPGEKPVLTDDEQANAQAAIHLARHGVFSHAPGVNAPAPDAFREPGYAAFVATVWHLAGSEVPMRPAGLAAGDARARDAVRPVQRAQRLLLALAALGAAAAVGWAGGRSGPTVAAVAAFALVALSPALARSADRFASEALAAPLATALACGLAALVERPSNLRALVAGLVAGALALVKAAFPPLAVALALCLPLLLGGHRGRHRVAFAGVFLAAALLLPGLWIARNAATLGHATLADRGGVVLLTRAELGVDVEREGTGAALAVWTPWPLGATAADGESRLERWSWRGEGGAASPFVRAMARRDALIRETGDPLAADARLRREALAALGAAPGRWLRATVPVAWRSLFAERSPAWLRPFDAALPIGLLLALGAFLALIHALRGADRPALALLLPVTAAYLFAVLATEGLPRFQQPSLPILWATVAATVDRLVARAGRRTASKDKTSG